MSSFRRLAKDHAALRASLPPNYLFSPADDADSLPDDLTQLSIYLTGSDGTPYCSGLWLLHLRIPSDYPRSPPKATFKTRIFHPNVEESTGAVCLETLKRDWDPKLTLKDILVTISCLLIQPNPDSALNEKAGVLVREDYEGFVRQAKLMTKIHAPIAASWTDSVREARRRGECLNDRVDGTKNASQVLSAVSLPKKNILVQTTVIEVSSSDESADSTKENNSSQENAATHGVTFAAKKHVLGKRPLTDINAGPDSEDSAISLSAKGIPHTEEGEPPRKSPKHTHQSQANGREARSLASGVKGGTVQFQGIHELPVPAPFPAVTSKPVTKSKYRTYARVGIKRL